MVAKVLQLLFTIPPFISIWAKFLTNNFYYLLSSWISFNQLFMINLKDIYDYPNVYKFNCDTICIGQTGCPFSQHYKEHIRALITVTESNYTYHLVETGHTHPNIQDIFQTLHTYENKKVPKFRALEHYKNLQYTKLMKNNILNEQTQFKSHTFFYLVLATGQPIISLQNLHYFAKLSKQWMYHIVCYTHLFKIFIAFIN